MISTNKQDHSGFGVKLLLYFVSRAMLDEGSFADDVVKVWKFNLPEELWFGVEFLVFLERNLNAQYSIRNVLGPVNSE